MDRNFHLVLWEEGLDVQCLLCDCILTLYPLDYETANLKQVLESCHFTDCELYNEEALMTR